MPKEPKNKNTILKTEYNYYDIRSYATDLNHESTVQQILKSIGTFSTVEEIDIYLKKKFPKSPITADMIARAAEQAQVEPEVIVAMMQADSGIGTQGKAVRTRNPGNVGNMDDGSTKIYDSWYDGVLAVANNLKKRRTTSVDQEPSITDVRTTTLPGGKKTLVNKTGPTKYKPIISLPDKISDLPPNKRPDLSKSRIPKDFEVNLRTESEENLVPPTFQDISKYLLNMKSIGLDTSMFEEPDFIQRINNPFTVPPLQNEDGTESTHEMMSFEKDGKYYAASTIVKVDGKLKRLTPDEADDYAFKNNEFKKFKTDQEAKDYANNGYKKNTPMSVQQSSVSSTTPLEVDTSKLDTTPNPPPPINQQAMINAAAALGLQSNTFTEPQQNSNVVSTPPQKYTLTPSYVPPQIQYNIDGSMVTSKNWDMPYNGPEFTTPAINQIEITPNQGNTDFEKDPNQLETIPGSTKTKKNHVIPMLGIDLFNFAANGAANLFEENYQKTKQRENQIVNQQPQVVAYNKRQLKGDKAFLKNGGEYKEGGEYEMDENEIERLRSLGYEFDITN